MGRDSPKTDFQCEVSPTVPGHEVLKMGSRSLKKRIKMLLAAKRVLHGSDLTTRETRKKNT